MRRSGAGEGPLSRRRVGARLLLSLLALALLIAGLAGAYSYGQAYSQHRGFVTIARLPRAGKGRLLNVNFYSPALHRRAYYLVYLPAGYAPTRHYPVFYLLHGMPGRPQVWIDIANLDVRLDNQLSQGHLRPMVLVFPDGRIGGSTYSDSEWADASSGHYESYVVDVVRDVDHRFAVLPVRSDRAIAGFSAGGYGAINIALHHLALFGSVQVWSGYFRQTRSTVFAHATGAQLAYNSPIEYVRTAHRQLRLDPLRVFMFVGRGDQASRQIGPMARALTAAGAGVRDRSIRAGTTGRGSWPTSSPSQSRRCRWCRRSQRAAWPCRCRSRLVCLASTSRAAAALSARRRAALRAIAAGVFYGVADGAIKADAVNLRAHGTGALLSGWTSWRCSARSAASSSSRPPCARATPSARSRR